MFKPMNRNGGPDSAHDRQAKAMRTAQQRSSWENVLADQGLRQNIMKRLSRVSGARLAMCTKTLLDVHKAEGRELKLTFNLEEGEGNWEEAIEAVGSPSRLAMVMPSIREQKNPNCLRQLAQAIGAVKKSAVTSWATAGEGLNKMIGETEGFPLPFDEAKVNKGQRHLIYFAMGELESRRPAHVGAMRNMNLRAIDNSVKKMLARAIKWGRESFADAMNISTSVGLTTLLEEGMDEFVFAAARWRQYDVMQFLVERMSDLEAEPDMSACASSLQEGIERSIEDARRKGDVKSLAEYLTQGPNGLVHLIQECAETSVKMFLFDIGVNIASTDLLEALERNMGCLSDVHDSDLANFQPEADRDCNHPEYRLLLLEWAWRRGYLDEEFTPSGLGENLFRAAVRTGHIQRFHQVIRKGFDLSQCLFPFNEVLSFSSGAHLGFLELAKEAGCIPSSSALQRAMDAKDRTAVRMLLEMGAPRTSLQTVNAAIRSKSITIFLELCPLNDEELHPDSFKGLCMTAARANNAHALSYLVANHTTTGVPPCIDDLCSTAVECGSFKVIVRFVGPFPSLVRYCNAADSGRASIFMQLCCEDCSEASVGRRSGSSRKGSSA